MKKIKGRYYKIGFDSSFASISRAIKEYPYNSNNSSGFELIEINRSKILARYIVKQVVSEDMQDPFGNIEKVTSIKYSIFMFEVIYISNGVALLLLINPPAHIKTFINSLNDIIEGFSIEKINLSIEAFYNYISRSKNIDRIIIDEINISSFQFSRHAVASMKIRSTTNAYEELKEKYKNGRYRMDKISFTMRLSGNVESISLSSSGLSNFTSGASDLIMQYVLTNIDSNG